MGFADVDHAEHAGLRLFLEVILDVQRWSS